VDSRSDPIVELPAAAHPLERWSLLRDPLLRVFVGGSFLLQLVAALYFGREILLPIMVAFLFALVFSPVMRGLRAWGLPAALGAVLIVGGLCSALAAGVFFLSGPIAAWIDDVPSISAEIRSKIEELRAPVSGLAEATQQVDELARGGQAGIQEVALAEPGLLDRAFSGAPGMAAKIALGVVMLLFLLATADFFYEKVVHLLPSLSDKKLAVRIVRDVEAQVSRYLFTITLINLGFGFSVGLALWLVGWPTPAVWAVAAVFLNYIPFVGGVIAVLGLGVVGLVSYDTVLEALVGPALYMALNVIENQLVTPVLVGRRLEINAVMILVAIAFWGQLWGIAGIVIAVPFLVILKVFADNVEALHPVGAFLSASHVKNGE
jgi:predicted PurR-regulated permease PerM